MTNYTILIKTALGVTTNVYYSYDGIDLTQLYKDAVLSCQELLIWERGILRLEDVVGIFKS